MRRLLVATTLVLALAGAGVAAADTGWIGRAPGQVARWASGPDASGLRILSAHALTGSLMRRGYADIAVDGLRGTSYVAEARDPHGVRVLLVVDGRTGEITGQRVLDWQGRTPRFDAQGWARPSPLDGGIAGAWRNLWGGAFGRDVPGTADPAGGARR